MKSDELDKQWVEIWREQPAAGSVANLDEFYASLQSGPDAWEEEFARSERQMMLVAALLLFSGLLNFGSYMHPGPHWGKWLLVGLTAAMGISAWSLRRKRLRLQVEYGPSLLERINRMRRMIRQRMRFTELSTFMSLPLAAVAGLFLVEELHADWWVGLAGALVMLGGMLRLNLAHQRKELARLRQRLEALDQGETQLTGVPVGAEPKGRP